MAELPFTYTYAYSSWYHHTLVQGKGVVIGLGLDSRLLRCHGEQQHTVSFQFAMSLLHIETFSMAKYAHGFFLLLNIKISTLNSCVANARA